MQRRRRVHGIARLHDVHERRRVRRRQPVLERPLRRFNLPLQRRAGLQCRASAGPCDIADACDGQSQTCPSDDVAPAGQVCRAPSGGCDVAEVCSGDSKACPSDRAAPLGTVCRAGATPCDEPERCDGGALACPADAVATNGTVCRASAGVCDVPELCDGQTDRLPIRRAWSTRSTRWRICLTLA